MVTGLETKKKRICFPTTLNKSVKKTLDWQHTKRSRNRNKSKFSAKKLDNNQKVSEIKMLLGSNKPPHEVTSYRPISILVVISKWNEKLFIKRLKTIIDSKNLIPNHRFGFRCNHSTINQIHTSYNRRYRKSYEWEKDLLYYFLGCCTSI